MYVCRFAVGSRSTICYLFVGSMVKGVVAKKPSGTVRGSAGVLKRPSGVLAGSPHQVCRHFEIVKCLKSELSVWVASLSGASRQIIECPLCGRTSDRLFNMQRHAQTHTTGRLSKLIGNIEAGRRQQHPIFLEIVRALYDNDLLVGKAGGRYAARARTLLSGWMQMGEFGSVYTKMGHRDENMVLVFTGAGPEFWHRLDTRFESVKTFAKDQFYTREFANEYVRHLLQEGGVYHKAMRSLRGVWQRAGCEVTQLLDRHSSTIANMSCELMECAAMVGLRCSYMSELAECEEYRSVSVDATYKLSLKVPGQDRNHKHSHITVIGTRGSPVWIEAKRGESPRTVADTLADAIPDVAREQVEHVASDACSRAFLRSMQSLFPNLQGCSLDALHLCFKVESLSKKHRARSTEIGNMMRFIMGKFNVPDPDVGEQPLYGGEALPPHSKEELGD